MGLARAGRYGQLHGKRGFGAWCGSSSAGSLVGCSEGPLVFREVPRQVPQSQTHTSDSSSSTNVCIRVIEAMGGVWRSDETSVQNMPRTRAAEGCYRFSLGKLSRYIM